MINYAMLYITFCFKEKKKIKTHIYQVCKVVNDIITPLEIKLYSNCVSVDTAQAFVNYYTKVICYLNLKKNKYPFCGTRF